ncbi:folate-binding protein [Palleronia sp. LCG004]|uniref:CAF17-like 4Fe-4S cluster assembly/insertion protein YgfZ n=1 Tax=Palleronia sp. LCG004 TaxID=3079304 RepID=UPI0029428B34|nr:folate-binding protein [Palleronia sp. LCG004]WOI55151.1 folate-binding protein [Palleronia sp. LCG004]
MKDPRKVLALTGADRVAFLQDLTTNDVTRPGTLVYSALLTPQGKYLADFFVSNRADALLIDVAEDLADALAQRLSMYRLRRDVAIEITDNPVGRGTSEAPDGALADPRHAAMGWRAIGHGAADDGTDWDALRVEHLVPRSGVELRPNESYPLEFGLDRLHGIDFRKGCYVGQEVTARMKHKTELKKGLARVRIDGPAEPGTEITAGEKSAGTLFTRSGDRALAWLRYDRAEGEMRAGDAVIVRDA